MNSFGKKLIITTWGESHGKALGVVVDGCPPNIELTKKDIQKELDRRKPGQSKVTTQRKEDDSVEILSGIFEGKTTGTPISLIVWNKDQDSSKYDNLKDIYRPGHADFTFQKKFGIRDHKGGGRSSGRETIGRVAAGAIAKKLIGKTEIIAYSDQINNIKAKNIDYSEIEKNPVRCADKNAANEMEKIIIKVKQEGDSLGGIVKLRIKNVPLGLGDPVFGKLDAELAKAIMSIGAVKGVEFGEGFNVAKMKGSENNDQIDKNGFKTNNAGGILGGISNGEDIIIKIAIKPTPSISKEQQTININNEEKNIKIEGRHDPCILPRIIPVIEAMASLVIADKILIQKQIDNNDK